MIRSSNAPEEELIVPCELSDCSKKFRTFGGMRTHLKIVHNISYAKRKIPIGATKCSNCNKEFETPQQLKCHGSPETCAKRLSKGWKTLICQNPACRKSYTKYIGPKGNRKGQKYCSTDCAQKCRYRITIILMVCPVCNKEFESKYANRKYCGKDCHNKVSGYKIKDTSKMGGPRDGGGRSKLLPYVNNSGESMKLNREEILVAEYLDSTDHIWCRNWNGFPYVDLDGNNRKFYPDFYIKDLDTYLEYKGWITEEMWHKMTDAQNRNPSLKLLIVVGDDPRYLHLGTPLKDSNI